MNAIWNDVRFAVRTLRKSPLFTAVAVVSLALGIGANTAIFTLLDAVLLKLLPVKDPQQLVALKMEGHHYGSNWGMNAISFPMYQDFRDNNQVFSGMFCRFPIATSLGFGNRTDRVYGELVSGTYFPVLGVTAAVGRILTPQDDRFPGGHPLVMLSYAYWQSHFASDRSIVGKTLVVNGRNMTVVGVAQAGFEGVQLERPSQIFIPIMMKAQMTPNWDGLKDRRYRWVNTFGRLKPGVTMVQAKASLQPFMHSMLEMEVKEPAFKNASAYDRQQFLKNVIDLLPGGLGQSYIRESMTTPLWLLMGITGAVLLMACTNIANLLLARATGRQREVAVRVAVGASRGQIIRQLLVESFLISAIGAVIGLFLAFWANRLLMAMISPENSSEFNLNVSAAPDATVLIFTFAVMFVTALLFGLVPALRTANPEIAPVLKNEAGSVVGGTNVGLRKALVVLQVTLSLLLLISAGLFLKTLGNLRNLGPGFAPERLIGFNIDPSLNGYTSDKAKIFYKRLSDEIAALPGVRSVGLASIRILEGNEWDSSMTVEGYTPKPADRPQPYMNSVSPNYFGTLGIPVLQGRDFTINDVKEIKHGPDADDWSPAYVIINEKFANKYFAGRNPIGLHVGFGSDPGTKTDMQVIGVVKNIKYTSLRDEVPVQAFVPYLAGHFIGAMTVYVRTNLDSKELMPLIRRKLHALDPSIPVYEVRTTEEQISLSLASERLVASLSSVFGFLATLLAMTGLYGVMAYTVARRTREIGIRMALGAIRQDVVWMVMKEVFLLIAIGVVVGVPASIALTYLVKSQLYGLAPHDAGTVVTAIVLSVGVACLAGFLPALRASRVDPTQALRYE